MKHLWKVLLLLMLCVVMMASCGNNPSDDDTTTTEPTGGDETPVVETLLPIVKAGSTSDYKVVIADDSRPSTREIVDEFILRVQEKTGSKRRLGKIYDTTAPVSDYEITINAPKGRDDAAQMLNTISLADYDIRIVGNRIIITSYSDEGISTALTSLRNAIKKDADNNWSISSTFAESGCAVEMRKSDYAGLTTAEQEDYANVIEALGKLPRFATENGVLCPLYFTGNFGYSQAIINSNKAEYEAHLQKLLDMGYTQYSARTVSAGSDKPDEENIYHTLVSEKTNIYMEWLGNLDTVNVMIAPKEALPSLEKPSLTSADNVPVTVAQMQLSLNTMGGMSYVYQLADGKFILVDGGVSHQLNSDILMNYLQEKAAAAGMDKPVVAMWLFSHAHQDHIGLANNGFLERAKNEGVVIESFGFNFVDQKYMSDKHTSEIKALKKQFQMYFPDATVYNVHAGQVFYFKGLEMEILVTQEELYPHITPSAAGGSTQNSACVAWRVTMTETGKTVIFLADNTPKTNEQMAKIYRDYLKSDVMQTAHHGLSGAEITCYKMIDPDICLWPSPYDRFMGNYGGKLFGNTLDQHQWGLGFSFVLNEKGQPIDAEGNPTDDPALAQKKPVTSDAANIWLLDESIKDRYDLHNSETAIVSADLSVKIERTEDPGYEKLTTPLPEIPTDGSTPDYKEGVIPYASVKG